MAGRRVSQKVTAFPPSLTLALKALVAERRAAGLPVFDFGLGETRGALRPSIADAAVAAYRGGRTVYGDPAGLPELRAAIPAWLGIAERYGADSVVVTTGAKQALMNVFLAALDPGDVALLDCAPWVSYRPLALAASARPVCVTPAAGTANRLKITPDDLARAIEAEPRARLFLANSPCNPTAQIYDAGELDALARTCAEREIYFVLDRLYWKLTYDGLEFPEPVVDRDTRLWLVQVDGLSKNFRRTGGMRIGWTVAPEDLDAGPVRGVGGGRRAVRRRDAPRARGQARPDARARRRAAAGRALADSGGVLLVLGRPGVLRTPGARW